LCGRAAHELVFTLRHVRSGPLRSAQVRSGPHTVRTLCAHCAHTRTLCAHCAHTHAHGVHTACATNTVRTLCAHCVHTLWRPKAPLTVVSHGGAHERSTKSVVRAQGVHEQQARESVGGVPRRQGQHALQADRRCYFVRGGWGVVCPTNKHVACGTGLHSAAVGTPQLPGFVLLVRLVHIRSRTTTNGIVRMPCFESSSKSGSSIVGGHDRTSTNHTVRTFWFDVSCNHSSKTAALASGAVRWFERPSAAGSQTPGVCARCGSASWA
jgi:hypothetical protein